MGAEQWTVAAIVTALAGAGLAKLWVFGWTFNDMKEDRDFWRDTALNALNLGDKAIDVAVKSRKAR